VTSTPVILGSLVHVKAVGSDEMWRVVRWTQGYMTIRPINTASGEMVSTDQHDEVHPPSELEHYDDYLARVAAGQRAVREAEAEAVRPPTAVDVEMEAGEAHSRSRRRASLVKALADARAEVRFCRGMATAARLRLAEFDAEVDGSTTNP
jgi:hypothetical protein